MVKLTRFWFEFDKPYNELPPGLAMGCGVTAWNYDDALNILRNPVFEDEYLPPFKKVVENIDVSTLEKGHVLPNIMPSNVRGIWYPIGYFNRSKF
jgi:hypothetical protein